MKCPRSDCGVWSTIKETRGVRRRRECANGHRFTTVEITVEDDRNRAVARRLGVARQTLRNLGILQHDEKQA